MGRESREGGSGEIRVQELIKLWLYLSQRHGVQMQGTEGVGRKKERVGGGVREGEGEKRKGEQGKRCLTCRLMR